MAKATKRQIEIKVVKIETQDNGVVLELTQEETEFLSTVLSRIAGNRNNTCREHDFSIECALANIGYHYSSSRFRSKMCNDLICS